MDRVVGPYKSLADRQNTGAGRELGKGKVREVFFQLFRDEIDFVVVPMRTRLLPAPVQRVAGFKRNVADQNFSVSVQTAAQCGQEYDLLRVRQMVQRIGRDNIVIAAQGYAAAPPAPA